MGKIARHFYLFSYFFLMIALIVVGTSFTKFRVIGPIYLHDFVLLLIVASMIINPPRRMPFSPVLILLFVSLIYLIISVILNRTGLELIVRQYAIFGYIGCYYLIFIKTLGTPLRTYRNLIFLIGLLSISIQLIYVIYLMINGVSVLDEYHYYSPAIVLGIIIGGASVLVFISSWGLKIALFFLILVLSTSTGHSSAALSLIVLFGMFALLGVNGKSKLFLMFGGIAGLLTLYAFLPQFQDNNASFRLIAWSYTMKRILVENFGFIGEGFGIPYFDKTLILELYDKLGSVGLFGADRVVEGYLSSVHNSFLTIFLSIGLLPGLLIFFPFVRLFHYLNNRPACGTPDSDFFFLSLVGVSVWVSFNEILELPHSAGLFWLIYFCSLSVSTKAPSVQSSAE